MCPPMRAHWRRLANTIELVLPWGTRGHNPNGKSIISGVFAQLTAESPYTLQRAPLSPKIATSHGGSGPPSNTWFLGAIRAHNPNGISIGSAVFAQMTSVCVCTLQCTSPQNCPFPRRGSGPHLIHGSLGPPKSAIQTASRSVQPFSQGSLVWQTDRPTDSRYSVGNKRPNLRT